MRKCETKLDADLMPPLILILMDNENPMRSALRWNLIDFESTIIFPCQLYGWLNDISYVKMLQIFVYGHTVSKCEKFGEKFQFFKTVLYKIN